MEITLSAQKVPTVQCDGLEVVLVLILEVLHFLDIHANLYPGHVMFSVEQMRGRQMQVFHGRGEEGRGPGGARKI